MKFLAHLHPSSGLKKTCQRASLYALALLALAMAAMLVFKASERLILAHQVQTIQQTTAQELLGALMANDSAQLSARMASLEKQPGIQTAELVTRDGVSLASFIRPGQSVNPHSAFALASFDEVPGQRFTTIPMRFDGMDVANLHVLLSVWPVYQQVLMWVGLSLMALWVMYVGRQRVGLKIRWETAARRVGHGAPFDLQQALRLALEEAQISIQLEPARDMRNAGVSVMAVSVCWAQANGSLLKLSPADFMEEAFKEDVCLPLGDWLFETACHQAAQLQRAHGPLILAFKFSPRQLQAPNFLAKVRAICEATQFPYEAIWGLKGSDDRLT